MTLKAKRRLTDISFEHAGAHVALVGKAVGGGANGKTTLITKSTSDITETEVQSHLTSIEKAKYYQEIRTALEEGLRDQFSDSIEYNWLYLEDFNDTEVIFCTDGEIYSCGYTVDSNDKFTFDAVAKEVDVKRVYVFSPEGEILIADDATEYLMPGVVDMLNSALSNPDSASRATQVLKSVYKKETKKMDEIQKAVDAAKQEAAITIAELTKAVADLTAKVDGYVVAEKAAKQNAREVALTELVGAEKATAVVKSSETLSDESFAVLVETFKGFKQVDTDLMKQVSGQGSEQEKVSATAEILKARFAQ